MKFSTEHELLPNASAFADILASDLTAREALGDRGIQFKAVQLPALKVPSGRIVACDAYVLSNGEPFTQPVPSGNYPVTLAIAQFDSDERVAFAQVRFTNSKAVRWAMAVWPEQDTSKIQKGQIYGYGVDSGTGCFMDGDAYELIVEAYDYDNAQDEMMAESDQVYRPTRSWLSIETDRGSMALFSTGFGDGFYASYFGFSQENELVSLVTDFGIVKSALTQ